ALTAFFIAQFLKVIIDWAVNRTFNFRRTFGMGGMPSSHTAFLVSLTSMVAMREGMGSVAFAISTALMMVVVYDAMGVRLQTGKQSQVINRMLHRMLVEGKPLGEAELQELIGHTPTEVFSGAIIGLIVPIFFR
ncbi:MAG: divergent PAP2 family protein, partial [Clostridiales bacterium]|nr:divergent PAP2 family protein [Clostridiales bacterium]